MNRLFTLSRAYSLKGLAFAAWSWLFGYALPVLAQKAPAGQIVAAEIKGLPTHENSGFIEGLFTVINTITGIALAGALIFGLIWLLQRRNVVDDAEKDASTDTPVGDSTAGASDSDASKEQPTASAENADAVENAEKSETTEQSGEKKDDEKAAD